MRYLLLLLLNLPIIVIALMNIVTRYKTKSISRTRFKTQMVLWILILTVLIGSFPIYNALTGNPILGSERLSLFDIVQTTVIVHLIYIINNQRQKIDKVEKIVHDLHRDLSIKLSSK